MTKPLHRIAITPGEPAGIGPDIVIQLAQQSHPVELIVIADPDLLQQRAAQLQLPLKIIDYDPYTPAQIQPAGSVVVYPQKLNTVCIPGQLNPANSAYVLTTLEIATQGCLQHEFGGLLTGPIHKGIINAAGFPFSGHTEWLAEKCGNVPVVMMLATQQLRVALVTTHLPLRQVADAITPSKLFTTLHILRNALCKEFHIAAPRILVAGLNPHAGEHGHMGTEEITIITPVLNELRAQGWQITGPLAADTLFTPKYLNHADAVLAMYHDQGLPVLKYQGFGRAVNITLGLPFLRISVDHGTALDLAGTGQASHSSLAEALKIFCNLM